VNGCQAAGLEAKQLADRARLYLGPVAVVGTTDPRLCPPVPHLEIVTEAS
jgi:hypothetical protein